MGHPHIQWFADPAVLAPIALMVWIYVRRFREARREAGGRGAGPLQALAFGGAVLALLAALVSPIDGLGSDYLFSAHMLQHVLLGDIAPLLLLLSLSRVIMRPATRRLARVEKALGPLASPWTAIAIWLGTMYLWHIPAIYDAAAEHPLLHALEHLSFFAAGRGALVAADPAGPDAQRASPACSRSPTSHWRRAVWPRSASSSPGARPRTTPGTRTRRGSGASNPVEDQNVAGVIMMVEQSLTLVLVMVWVVRADAGPLGAGGAAARAAGGARGGGAAGAAGVRAGPELREGPGR